MRERGVSSVQFLLASALALILFLAFANLVVVQYGRGAIRSALDQAARVAATTGSVLECRDRAETVLDELLGGSMGTGVAIECRFEAELAVASATAVFHSWTPLSGDFVTEMSSSAVVEWGS